MKNKQNKIANFLKLGALLLYNCRAITRRFVLTLLFTFSLLLLGCSEDNYLTEEAQPTKELIERISYESAIKTLSLENNSAILNRKSEEQSKTSRFTLSKNRVKKIEKNNYTTYTFLLEKKDEEDYKVFTNLVVTKYKNQKEYYQLVHYKVSNTYLSLSITDKTTSFKGKVIFLKSSSNLNDLLGYQRDVDLRTTCSPETIRIEYSCHSGKHWPGDSSCIYMTNGETDKQAYYKENTVMVCVEGGSFSLDNSGTNIDLGSDQSIGIEGGDTGSTSPNSPNILTSMTDELFELIGLLNITRNDEIEWLSKDNNHVSVSTFVKANNNSPEAIFFAKLVVKTLAENPDMTIEDVDFEEQIINLLTEKAKCVYNKLKENSLVNKTLKKFDGTDALINLELIEDNLDPNVSGETKYGIPIKIKLDIDDMKNTPSLWVAHTIIHEFIHADIYRKIFITGGLLYVSPGNYTLNGTRADFPTLFDYYDNYPNNAHHNYMADYYRTAMEEALKEYAASIGETYPDQLYKDLAWAGLENTNAWNNMYADPVYTANEQQRIKQAIINLKNSGNNECN